jgi:hypothetical protein
LTATFPAYAFLPSLLPDVARSTAAAWLRGKLRPIVRPRRWRRSRRTGIADWPGLFRNALLDDRDLRPTLDLRRVFKGVLDEHMHVDAQTLASRVFPDSSGARPLQGLMRA